MKPIIPRLQLPAPTNPPTHPPSREATEGGPGGNGAPKTVTENITGLVVFVTTSNGRFRQVMLADRQALSVLNFIKNRLHGGRLNASADDYKELMVR